MSIEDLRNMSIEELKSNEKFMSEVAKEYESTLEEFLSSPPKMIEMAINECLQKYSEINLDVQKKPQNIQDTMEAILQATEKNTVTAEETTKRIQTLQEQVGELQDTVTTLQDTVKKQDAKIDMLQRENNSQSEQLREQGEAFSAMLETKRDDIEYMTKKKTGAKKATIYILTDDKIFDYNKDENGKVGFQQVPIEDKEILETLKRGEVCQKDNKVYVPVIDTGKKVIGAVLGEDVPSIDNFVDVVQNQDNVQGRAILGNVQVKYSEVKAMIAETKAKTDEMTGLLNKAGKEEYIKKELIESAKKGESIATIMIDGDNFKSINDTYGHVAGDTVLKKWAEIMMECASEIMKKYSSDKVEVDVKVFRVGGDEAQAFVKINDQQENGENKVYIGAITYELAEMIRKKVAETKIEVINSESRKYEQVNTTISVGIAKVDTQNLTEDNVMEKIKSAELDADEGLKSAKKGFKRAKSGTDAKIVGRPKLAKNVTSTTPEVGKDVVDALMQESPDEILAIIQAETNVFDMVKENIDRIPSDKFSYLIENCKPFRDWIERPSENLNNGTNDKEMEQKQTGETVADPGYVPEESTMETLEGIVAGEKTDVPAQEPGDTYSIAEASQQDKKYIPNEKIVDAQRGNKPHGKDRVL